VVEQPSGLHASSRRRRTDRAAQPCAMVVGAEQEGDRQPAATGGFEAAREDLVNVGMTFGGGCYFGHGVFVTGGTARFITTGYAVE
jgi:uncharacterized membrane protein YedE/YeeE